ncbi:MAG TPA: hypothetical protein VMS31_09065 [Pyrinomonadaceae bacterium]|nr:hypothetical protein [Pyrinomonadaceae bacterium]
MYCPNCGQTQPSEEVRYCSRCGLSLGELARWLIDGANAPWAPIQLANEPSPRKKGIRRGAKVTFIGAVLLMFTFVMAIAVDGPELMVAPMLVLFVGLVWMLYCRLFVDNTPAAGRQGLAPASRPNQYLPPAQVNPVNVLRPREPNTSEIVQPPSVTEYTTNLLRNRRKT